MSGAMPGVDVLRNKQSLPSLELTGDKKIISDYIFLNLQIFEFFITQEIFVTLLKSKSNTYHSNRC